MVGLVRGACALAILVTLLMGTTLDAGQAQQKVAQGKPLTNKDVLALVQAGIPDAVVLDKIRMSQTAFDTSTEALIALRRAAVSTAVIQLMVNPGSTAAARSEVGPGVMFGGGTAANGPEACASAANGQLPWMSGSSPAMWYSTSSAGSRVEMQYERGTMHDVGFMGIGATLLLLKPKAADLRLPGDTVFLTCLNPTDTPLVRFSVDAEDDERHTSVARGSMFKRTERISDGDLVPVTFKKLPQGVFEVKAKTALAGGEYGFVPQVGFSYFMFGDRVYAFGVE